MYILTVSWKVGTYMTVSSTTGEGSITYRLTVRIKDLRNN
jgi:hypothetical protein